VRISGEVVAMMFEKSVVAMKLAEYPASWEYARGTDKMIESLRAHGIDVEDKEAGNDK
jgi:hypothetical protein